jgi:hypothetical protein
MQEELWHISYVSIWSVDLPYRKAIAYCRDGNGSSALVRNPMAVTSISIYADIRSKKSWVKPNYIFHLGASLLQTLNKYQIRSIACGDCLDKYLVERK